MLIRRGARGSLAIFGNEDYGDLDPQSTERAGANPWAPRRPARERGGTGSCSRRGLTKAAAVAMAAVGVRRALVSAGPTVRSLRGGAGACGSCRARVGEGRRRATARNDRPTEAITSPKRGTPVRHVDVARARRHLGVGGDLLERAGARGSVRTGCAHVGRRGRGARLKKFTRLLAMSCRRGAMRAIMGRVHAGA